MGSRATCGPLSAALAPGVPWAEAIAQLVRPGSRLGQARRVSQGIPTGPRGDGSTLGWARESPGPARPCGAQRGPVSGHILPSTEPVPGRRVCSFASAQEKWYFPHQCCRWSSKQLSKSGDFHCLLTEGRFKLVTYKQRALYRCTELLCSRVALPEGFNLSSHPGCHRDRERQACWSAGGCPSPPGPVGSLSVHAQRASMSILLPWGFLGCRGTRPPNTWDPLLACRSQPHISSPSQGCSCLWLSFHGHQERRRHPMDNCHAFISLRDSDWHLPGYHHHHPSQGSIQFLHCNKYHGG